MYKVSISSPDQDPYSTRTDYSLTDQHTATIGDKNYEIHRYEKNLDKPRGLLIAEAICFTLFSAGLALFSSDVRKMWSDGIDGKKVREVRQLVKPDWDEIIHCESPTFKASLTNMLQKEKCCAYEAIFFFFCSGDLSDVVFEEDGRLKNGVDVWKDDAKRGKCLLVFFPRDQKGERHMYKASLETLKYVQPKLHEFQIEYDNKVVMGGNFEDYSYIHQGFKIPKDLKNTILHGNGLEFI